MLLRRISLLLLAVLSAGSARASDPYRANLSHLLSLVQTVKLNGEDIDVVDIYADYPAYKPVVAKGEGFACVDDAARAAVLLIRYNQVLHRRENIRVINGIVKFILAMQTRDGRFYNFLENDGGQVRINTHGRTSYASFGWWAARAVWALGEAAVYYKNSNKTLYRKVTAACERSMGQVDSLLKNYGRLSPSGNPTWLLYGDGADASSELVLGLNALYSATGERAYRDAAGKLCDGMILIRKGSCAEAPYGMFASNGEGWHGWANSQAAAIMKYSRLSGDKAFLAKAVEEVDCFLPRWAGALFFRSCNSHGDSLDYSGQIAYGIQPAVSAAAEAYEITRDAKYKTLACVIASWFFGNNTMRSPFYFERTGLCFDGSIDSLNVNRNSGAESTIEALLTMIELRRIAADFHTINLTSRASFSSTNYNYDYGVKTLTIKMTPGGFKVRIVPHSN